MKSSNQLASFFAGMFLANAIPHFVNGVSGDRFPTPFANPPGKGLSSPTVNVAWALTMSQQDIACLRQAKSPEAIPRALFRSWLGQPPSAQCSASSSPRSKLIEIRHSLEGLLADG
jgi:hypothetical protein